IDKADASDIGRPLRQPFERDADDKAAEILGQGHDDPPKRFPESREFFDFGPLVLRKSGHSQWVGREFRVVRQGKKSSPAEELAAELAAEFGNSRITSGNILLK